MATEMYMHLASRSILIVGCGFAGATIARILAEKNFLIDIIDSRNHIAGNAYDYVDDNGFRIHKYGPHLFHTNNKKVFDWLSRFTNWIEYKHQVNALLDDGSFVALPPNKDSVSRLGLEGVKEKLIRPYTRKMWGLDIENIDPAIINRIKIRDDYNSYYFPNDRYQYLPCDGYSRLISNMLNHQNIHVSLNTSFKHSQENDYYHVFTSMAIDEYFGFCLGNLPYRSLKFTTVSFPAPRIFPTAVTNFTHSGPNTRVTEWNHLPNHGWRSDMTALTYEEPCDYKENNLERYYPINDVAGVNHKLYKDYSHLTPQNITFIGRCGQYKYLNMDQVVASSSSYAEQFYSR